MWPLLLLWRGESQAATLTGHLGGPQNEVTITEPEASQVLQLVSLTQLQAHWPLSCIKPARRSVLKPCSCFQSGWYLCEPGEVLSLPDRMAQEVTAGVPGFLPASSLQVSFGLWKSKSGSQLRKAVRLSELYQNSSSKSFLTVSSRPASLRFSLLTGLFPGSSHPPHLHRPGTAP